LAKTGLAAATNVSMSSAVFIEVALLVSHVQVHYAYEAVY
jgi:hypothetical protein